MVLENVSKFPIKFPITFPIKNPITFPIQKAPQSDPEVLPHPQMLPKGSPMIPLKGPKSPKVGIHRGP